jgi:chemotaxis protein MotA
MTIGGRRLDAASLAILPAGILIVLAAQLLEGGTARSLVQGPAALIVFGGTAAALLISYSPRQVLRAIRAAAATFTVEGEDMPALVSRFVGYGVRSHRKGLLSLDSEIEAVEDPFLKSGLSLVVDGVAQEQLEVVLDAWRSAQASHDEAPARVFDAAAGYAPTLGILGAVLGLIHVMQNLAQPSALGSGIAVAFVATVYGVGAANLLFLPIAGRLRERAARAARRRELVTEGLLALHQRMHPRVMAHRLRAFETDTGGPADAASRPAEAAARMAGDAPASRIPA